jgi:ribosomal protein S18 acetylase RimI-like enzyme
MRWRGYDPEADRTAALEILREQHRRGRLPFAIHPGEWDWWVYHHDPRQPVRRLITDGALADVAPGARQIAVFGCPVEAAIELGHREFPDRPWAISGVSAGDASRIAALQAAGFAPTGDPWPLFERSTGGAVLPAGAGFEIRAVLGEDEHAARAGAARRAFESTLGTEQHDARYLAFMRSPAYVRDNDLVAVAPDGRVGAFTIVWPDAELSVAQFEPVGTDPDFQRRGLGRAIIAAGLARLAAAGIARARVMTVAGNTAAVGLYLACGFVEVDRVGTWTLS